MSATVVSELTILYERWVTILCSVCYRCHVRAVNGLLHQYLLILFSQEDRKSPWTWWTIKKANITNTTNTQNTRNTHTARANTNIANTITTTTRSRMGSTTDTDQSSELMSKLCRALWKVWKTMPLTPSEWRFVVFNVHGYNWIYGAS